MFILFFCFSDEHTVLHYYCTWFVFALSVSDLLPLTSGMLDAQNHDREFFENFWSPPTNLYPYFLFHDPQKSKIADVDSDSDSVADFESEKESESESDEFFNPNLTFEHEHDHQHQNAPFSTVSTGLGNDTAGNVNNPRHGNDYFYFYYTSIQS